MGGQIYCRRRYYPMNVVIVDYGMGNLHSLMGALHYSGATNVVISGDPDIINDASHIILPGVGAFGHAIARLDRSGIGHLLKHISKTDPRPILGVCLGMQLLGLSSDERGSYSGLGLFCADVAQFKAKNLTVPHVGFNQVTPKAEMKLFYDIAPSSDFYFTHSHRMLLGSRAAIATCHYGDEFVAGFEDGMVAGVQFHPELSQRNGIKLIQNFLELFHA